MTQIMIRMFVPNYKDVGNPMVRRGYGYLAGITGICANLVLFSVKLFIGFLTNSIAVMADAFNNLTDCASSIMTLVGFWTSGKPADKEHPFGHGRSEHIAALGVSILVIVVGIQFVRSSAERIMNPVPLSYDTLTVLILITTVAVKAWLAVFYRTVGKSINSKVMEATSMDSLGDVATTGIVVASLIAGPYIPFAFDGFIGLAVALLIIWNGWNLVMDTLSPLLGEAPDEEFLDALKAKVDSYDGVLGHHDIVVHNYGHGRTVVSLHVEVPVSMGMIGAHELIDFMEKEMARDMGIDLVIHMDPVDTENEETMALKASVEEVVKSMDTGLGFHDFRIVHRNGLKMIFFDIVIPSGLDMEANLLTDQLTERVMALSGDCQVHIQADREFAMLHAANEGHKQG